MVADIQDFKNAMSQMASGVTIVTSFVDNLPFGMTVSSFTSVSIHPPMISICIDKRVAICSVIEKAGRFAVSVLAQEQIQLGKIFADPKYKMPERFEHGIWQQTSNLTLVLADALAWLDCSVHSTHDIGDHFIFVGEVQTCHAQEKGVPAIYHHRHWHALLPQCRLD